MINSLTFIAMRFEFLEFLHYLVLTEHKFYIIVNRKKLFNIFLLLSLINKNNILLFSQILQNNHKNNKAWFDVHHHVAFLLPIEG